MLSVLSLLSIKRLRFHIRYVDCSSLAFIWSGHQWRCTSTGFAPPPRVRNWRISIASKEANALTDEVSYGRSLYQHPAGRNILDGHRISLLNLGSVHEVCYLTMYHKARMLGWDDDAANRFACIRGNVYSFFVSLLSSDQIVERFQRRAQ